MGNCQVQLVCTDSTISAVGCSALLQDGSALSLVSKQHVASIIGLAFFAPDSLLSVSQDGVVGLWTVSRLVLRVAHMQPVVLHP